MKTTFTKEFMLKNGGCYLEEEGKIERLFFSNDNTEITFEDIINSNIPLKDKYWFFCKKFFTREQNKQISISVAEIVLPIYEKKYPKNKAPREAINSAKLYITGHISLDELLIKRRAAAAAAAAAYAAYADAAAAAYAAYADAADAADAAVYDAADAAVYAASAASDDAYASAYASDDAYAAAADDAAAAYAAALLNNLYNFISNEKRNF